MSGRGHGVTGASASLLRRLPDPAADVEVWEATLEAGAGELLRCAGKLARDELDRADRFHFDRDRRRFIVARWGLRAVLGKRLRIAPAAVQLSCTEHGKPVLRGGNAGRVHFNLSHAGERAIYALSAGWPVGADIECLRDDVDFLALAGRYFCRGEWAALRQLPEPARKRAFFACWTRKEAVVKATGAGLAWPLDSFEVTVDPDAPPRLVAACTLLPADWSLHTVDVGEQYYATVAVCRGP